jgi:hypothetical protein
MKEFLELYGTAGDSVFKEDLRESMLIGYGVGNAPETG